MLGLEVVLADGRVLNVLNKLKKDNTGYDLRNLFIGAEGTLGIITAAVVKLFPRPRSVETAFVGVPSPRAALDLLNLVQERTGGATTSFELMKRLAIEMAVKHGPGCRDPLTGTHPWYVLLEVSSSEREGLRAALESALAAGAEAGLVNDATMTSGRVFGGCASCCRKRRSLRAPRSSTTSRCRSLMCTISSPRRTPRSRR